jgi:transcriptional regulator with XRE-family HTH domain
MRDAARSLAVSATTVALIEDGANHDELSLRLVSELARVLGVAPAELFCHQPQTAPEPTDDDRTLEAALLITSAATPDHALAEALGWPLARTRDALRTLENRLLQSGIRLHDHGWRRYALRPATEHLTQQQQHALHRIGPLERGLNAATAAMLYKIAEEGLTETWRKSATASQQLALQTLIKQGLVSIDTSGRFRISETAWFGLYPDQSHPPSWMLSEP